MRPVSTPDQVSHHDSAASKTVAHAPGKFSIVDVADLLPNLKRRPGLTTWKVAARGGKDKPLSWQGDVAEGNAKDLAETLWPPSNATELGLEKWYVPPITPLAPIN